MASEQKMTKQGVRDLNQPATKKVAVVEPVSLGVEDAPLLPPGEVAPEAPVAASIEP